MAHSSWGPGWPTNNSSKMIAINVSGTTFPEGIRKELAELVTLLVWETKRRGYIFGIPGNPAYGCWGYANRAISGTTKPSNHSWGLAVDINAPRNPQSTTFKTDMPAWMPTLWKKYGFRWGGDYKPPTKYDTMHYEFLGSVADAAFYTVQARQDFTGIIVPPPIISPPTLPLPEDEVTPADINAIVAAVNATLTPQIQACLAESQKATAVATQAAKEAQSAKQVANSAYNATLEVGLEVDETQRQIAVISGKEDDTQKQVSKLSEQVAQHDLLVRGPDNSWKNNSGLWLDDATWLEIMRARNAFGNGGSVAQVDYDRIADEVREKFHEVPLTGGLS